MPQTRPRPWSQRLVDITKQGLRSNIIIERAGRGLLKELAEKICFTPSSTEQGVIRYELRIRGLRTYQGSAIQHELANMAKRCARNHWHQGKSFNLTIILARGTVEILQHIFLKEKVKQVNETIRCTSYLRNKTPICSWCLTRCCCIVSPQAMNTPVFVPYSRH